MAGRPGSKGSILGVAERRARTRTLVSTPIYVDLDSVNGGLVFNLSESGLALTTALNLPDDDHVNMRIQSPDTKKWIEVDGEIAWRSKSGKEAGVRFVGLTEEAQQQVSVWMTAEILGEGFHAKEDAGAGLAGGAEAANQRIKNWMATEARRGKLQAAGDTCAPLPGLSEDAQKRLRSWIFQEASDKESAAVKDYAPAKQKRPADVASVHAQGDSILEPANPSLSVHAQGKESVVSATADARLGHTKKEVAKSTAKTQAVPDVSQEGQDAFAISERRARVRALLTPPIYVDLEKVNGGLIYDLNEDGLALTAANTLPGDGPLKMRIQLPDVGDWIEAVGQFAWKSESGKTAGIKFTALPDGARQRIGKWLAEESLLPDGPLLPKLEHSSAHDSPGKTAASSSLNAAKPSVFAERNIQKPVLPEDSSVLIDKPTETASESILQSTPALSNIGIGGESSPHLRERRVHKRSRIRPVSYIELGGDNGGTLLNIGEGGLSIIAAMPLSSVDVPAIRLRFTGSQDCIEASGQIAWIGESKKEAGIRFVNLTEGARRKIASRILQEESQDEVPAQRVKLPDSSAIHSEKQEISKAKFPVLADVPRSGVMQEPLRPPASLLHAAQSKSVEKARSNAVASGALRLKSPKKSELKPKPSPVVYRMTSDVRAKRLRRLAATFVLAGVTAVAIGWIVAAPAVRNEVIAFIAKNTEGPNKRTEATNPIPEPKASDLPAPRSELSEAQTGEIVPLPLDRPANDSATHKTPVAPLQTIEHPGSKPAVSVPVRRAESSLPKTEQTKSQRATSQPTKLPEHDLVAVPKPAADNTRNQTAENSTIQPKENPATATTSPSPSIPSVATSPEVKEKKEISPPLPKQPIAPAGPIWSVAVSTDPYPSIRIPASVSSQKASPGRNLQIGSAISRVEPVYPEDAKRQGIEGTVRLHVIVGRDGVVQSVELTSGPSLLARAAESAVREWRYAQTLLGGQPVETEQDVVVQFRLVSQSNSKN